MCLYLRHLATLPNKKQCDKIMIMRSVTNKTLEKLHMGGLKQTCFNRNSEICPLNSEVYERRESSLPCEEKRISL